MIDDNTGQGIAQRTIALATLGPAGDAAQMRFLGSQPQYDKQIERACP